MYKIWYYLEFQLVCSKKKMHFIDAEATRSIAMAKDMTVMGAGKAAQLDDYG